MRRVVLATGARVTATLAGCRLVATTVATATDAQADTTAPSVATSLHTTTTTTIDNNDSNSMTAAVVAAAPHRRVGNIFIVTCVDHPFKFAWEVNRMLRELRLEFMGQTVIVPDLPDVRKRLWRVRHVVRIDMLDLDEAKALIGVPEHITFRDLHSQITPQFGRVRGTATPHLRSKMYFMRYRRMRLRDILHRDQIEKQLLEEKRKLLREQQEQQQQHEEQRQTA